MEDGLLCTSDQDCMWLDEPRLRCTDVMFYGTGLALLSYAKLKEFQARRREVQDVNIRTIYATRILILWVRIFGGSLLFISSVLKFIGGGDPAPVVIPFSSGISFNLVQMMVTSMVLTCRYPN